MRKTIYLLMVVSGFNTIFMLISYNQTEDEINQIEELLKMQESVKVTATMYNPETSQCDEDPLVTAGMYKINPKKASEQKWIAVSRDLLKRWGGAFDYGDKVYISGAGHKNGVYTIVDTMNKRFNRKIDFLETKGTKLYKYEDVLLAKL